MATRASVGASDLSHRFDRHRNVRSNGPDNGAALVDGPLLKRDEDNREVGRSLLSYQGGGISSCSYARGQRCALPLRAELAKHEPHLPPREGFLFWMQIRERCGAPRGRGGHKGLRNDSEAFDRALAVHAHPDGDPCLSRPLRDVFGAVSAKDRPGLDLIELCIACKRGFSR